MLGFSRLQICGVHTKMFSLKWHKKVLCCRDQWISKNKMGGRSQDSSLEPSDQVVQVGERWLDLESVLIASCRVAKRENILLDSLFAKVWCLFYKLSPQVSCVTVFTDIGLGRNCS